MAAVLRIHNESQFGWQKADLSHSQHNGIESNRPRLYLWAAGGTGMQVVSSFVMFCASGIFNDVEVIPVLFDIDDNCSSLHYAIRELELYYKIYKEAESHSTSRLFFGCSIRPIMIKRKNESALSLKYSFEFDVHWKDNSSGVLKVEKQQGVKSKSEAIKLMESLFGKQYVNNEDFAHKARPPYSSSEIRLQLGDLGENENFRHLLEMIDPVRDRIIIVGSAFGATGTAFVYELIRLLNQSHRQIPKALVLMEPFFQVVGCNHTENLTDDIMKQRARESMSFFNNCNLYNKLNLTYLIGTGIGFKVGRLSESGEIQKNPNSIHEFIGALAIADFCKRSVFEHEPEILCYAIPKSSADNINITDLLRTPNESSTMSFLTRFAIAMKYVSNIEGETIPSKVKEFCSLFRQWVSEMEQVSQDPFLSFDFEKPGMHTIIKGRKFTEENFMYSITHAGKSKPLFSLDDFIKGMTSVKRNGKENGLNLFLRQLESGTDALMEYISF